MFLALVGASCVAVAEAAETPQAAAEDEDDDDDESEDEMGDEEEEEEEAAAVGGGGRRARCAVDAYIRTLLWSEPPPAPAQVPSSVRC